MYEFTFLFFAALAMSAALPRPTAVDIHARHNKQYEFQVCSGSNNCTTVTAGNGGGCHNIPNSTQLHFPKGIFGCVLYEQPGCPMGVGNPGVWGNVRGDVDVSTDEDATRNKVDGVQSFYCGDSFW